MIKYIAFLGGLLSFSITCSFASFSKNVTVYTGNKASVNCEYDFYNDKLRILSIAEITRLPEDSFRILPQELRRTTPHQIYWLRFKIVNTSTQRLVLRTPRQYRICELYIPEGTGLVKKIFNIHQWWGENPFILNYPAFDLPITNNDRYYYLRVSSDEVTGLGFKVCDYGFFYSETIKKFTWFLLFFGIMLLALLYTAIFWLRIKDKVFFYYFLFLVSLIIFNLMIKGALNPLFENITFHYYYFTIPFAGMTVFLLLYIRKALALNDQFSRYNKVINYLIYLRLIILVVSIVLNNEWLLGDHVDLILLIPAYIIVFRFYKRSPKDYSYL